MERDADPVCFRLILLMDELRQVGHGIGVVDNHFVMIGAETAGNLASKMVLVELRMTLETDRERAYRLIHHFGHQRDIQA